jgi:hypothetical protein
MKRFIYFLIGLVLVFFINACGGTDAGNSSMGGGSSSMMGGGGSMGSAGSMMGGGGGMMGGGLNMNSLMMLAGPMMGGGGGGGGQQAPEAPKYMYLGDVNATIDNHFIPLSAALEQNHEISSPGWEMENGEYIITIAGYSIDFKN